ncbi:hypothetical protein [Gemmatimonas aurantiaca]|uniref:hypothetical protein n=1 Tax=Gemmatimonas aurantiaca TaxID=173480 RepID=UPI00301D2273
MGRSEVGRINVTSVVEADIITVPYDADAVYRVMQAAYDSLGIPITGLDPAKKTIENSGVKIRNRLGKMPISTYLDCGNSQIGPNADSYDVYLNVSTKVTPGPAAGTARLATLLEAQARPATYNQAYSVCSTRGVLEQKLADVVKARLAK